MELQGLSINCTTLVEMPNPSGSYLVGWFSWPFCRAWIQSQSPLCKPADVFPLGKAIKFIAADIAKHLPPLAPVCHSPAPSNVLPSRRCMIVVHRGTIFICTGHIDKL